MIAIPSQFCSQHTDLSQHVACIGRRVAAMTEARLGTALACLILP